ncbi:hypothetical protein CHX26_09150 [Porphyrobacter sp. HT-58-2]|uniref:O-antigen ligase family protein n=1 Tax=Porphyrobacter sp. HT-58-2 TaxID=2023229 RepID=UPI000CDBE4B3|nr:O-antigen ligase family protein [Porphyrobacter sp. HT-58-2]AUX69638.1 hypothetical protein CHX26_09150 [Porphyrobacter sp. HT-58-2]
MRNGPFFASPCFFAFRESAREAFLITVKLATERQHGGKGHLKLTNGRKIIRRLSVSAISDTWASKRESHWVWVGAFIVALALLGGSSRPDPVQNALLQPIAALLLIPAIVKLRGRDLERGRALCIFLASLLVWMTIQLLPLPSGFWVELPSMPVIDEIDQLAGIEDAWRPMSVAPFRGLNSLFGLIIPLSALLLALTMRWPSRLLLFAIVAIGLIDALFGMLQVVGGAGSVFYQYAFSGSGVPVGIFANENHSAVFSAIVLLILTRLALEAPAQKDPPWVRLSFAPAFILILLSVLITGSRAGFIAALAALVASSCMIWPAMRRSLMAEGQKQHRPIWRSPAGLALGGCAMAILLVVLAFIWFERTPAMDDILEHSSFEDLRWSLLPILTSMASEHWLVGTGFGSFDAVYRSYEPTALLLPAYVNHAHNDWLQLIIEGGLPSMIIFSGLLVWIMWAVALAGRGTPLRRERLIFWLAALAIIAAASFVDYPLRTPLFQAVGVWLLICLSSDRVNLASN